MFEEVKTLCFLEHKNKNKKDIDWDKIITDKAQEFLLASSDTHSMPPPTSYDPKTPNLKPTLGDTTILRVGEKRHADTNSKLHTEGKLLFVIFLQSLHII